MRSGDRKKEEMGIGGGGQGRCMRDCYDQLDI